MVVISAGPARTVQTHQYVRPPETVEIGGNGADSRAAACVARGRAAADVARGRATDSTAANMAMRSGADDG